MFEDSFDAAAPAWKKAPVKKEAVKVRANLGGMIARVCSATGRLPELRFEVGSKESLFIGIASLLSCGCFRDHPAGIEDHVCFAVARGGVPAADCPGSISS